MSDKGMIEHDYTADKKTHVVLEDGAIVGVITGWAYYTPDELKGYAAELAVDAAEIKLVPVDLINVPQPSAERLEKFTDKVKAQTKI